MSDTHENETQEENARGVDLAIEAGKYYQGPSSLAVVRQAAESKPDDPIYRLVLAAAVEQRLYSQVLVIPIERVAECAREIEAAK